MHKPHRQVRSWKKAKIILDMIKHDMKNETDPDKKEWLASYGLRVNKLLTGI